MITQNLPIAHSRLPGVLLTLAPLPFIGVIVTAISTFSAVGDFAEITPQQMATIGVGWALAHIFFGIAFLLAGGGIATLFNILKGTNARLLAWIALGGAVLSIVMAIVFVALRVSVISFTETTLGLVSRYQWSDSLIQAAGVLHLCSLGAACVGLFMSNKLKWMGLSIGLLTVLLVILFVVMGFPPFVAMFLWLPLGIGLLRRKE